MVPVFTTWLTIAGRVTSRAVIIDTPNGGHISKHRIALLAAISWLPKVRASSPSTVRGQARVGWRVAFTLVEEITDKEYDNG
jgi:hypothetical protein